MLFSEPKIPQFIPGGRLLTCYLVSVLFSEPKIPQFVELLAGLVVQFEFQCSSASRKFLNAAVFTSSRFVNSLFQCSSASRKFLNRVFRADVQTDVAFQCSSASRKFLNPPSAGGRCAARSGFSALQRAENSSMHWKRSIVRLFRRVSVLFSEPKIPQLRQVLPRYAPPSEFQCSSASRKFLNKSPNDPPSSAAGFQCSSASRKFLNGARTLSPRCSTGGFSALQRAENSSIKTLTETALAVLRVSVLFSEPKIPQCLHRRRHLVTQPRFQCSSASRKFLNSVVSAKRRPVAARFSALQRAENSSIVGRHRRLD